MRMSSARGQATVEAIALVPVLLIVGVGLMQLLAVGYASVLAGGAAEAGALALARGTDPRASALRALPGWSEANARIALEDGRVQVRLRPPSVLRALGERVEVNAAAEVEVP